MNRRLYNAADQWSEDVSGGRLDGDHGQCEPSWECECGRLVCPRCEPSPGEFRYCAECHWLKGGDVA
jgi:hypothetical protein